MTDYSPDGYLARTTRGLLALEPLVDASNWVFPSPGITLVSDPAGNYFEALAGGETGIYTGIPNQSNLVVQAELYRVTAPTMYGGQSPCLTALSTPSSPGDYYTAVWAQILRGAGPASLDMFKCLGGSFSLLSSTAGTQYDLDTWTYTKLWCKPNVQRMWTDITPNPIAGQYDSDGSLAGVSGLPGITSATSYTNGAARWRNFSFYSDDLVYVTGLPTGYTIYLTGQQNKFSGLTPISGSGDPLTLDLIGWICPFDTVTVKNGSGVTVSTWSVSGGFWGGDVLVFDVTHSQGPSPFNPTPPESPPAPPPGQTGGPAAGPSNPLGSGGTNNPGVGANGWSNCPIPGDSTWSGESVPSTTWSNT